MLLIAVGVGLWGDFGGLRWQDAKPKRVDRTQLVMEVKGWEADTDLRAVWEKIKTEVTMEGLQWGEGINLVPVAYGVSKLVIRCAWAAVQGPVLCAGRRCLLGCFAMYVHHCLADGGGGPGSCVIVDDLVRLDDVMEPIEAMEDLIQS
jgi:translation elongation factor EF-1beta